MSFPEQDKTLNSLWNVSETARALRQLHEEQGAAYTDDQRTAQAALDLIATHCEIVARLAVVLAEQSGEGALTEHTLIEGALAHDIGTYSVLAHNAFAHNQVLFQRDIYIQHGTRGYELLLANGFGEEIAAFARNHTGVGITKADCVQQKLPIEPADYMPTNAAQEIVALADKFHTKSLPPRFVSEQTARARVEKFGSENIARWDKLVACYGAPPRDVLDELAHEYRMEIL